MLEKTTRDFDEKHIRRAVERQDAQTQSRAPADVATDSTPTDIQPDDERTTQTRPRESDLPLRGGQFRLTNDRPND